jgi:hypothetical protein
MTAAKRPQDENLEAGRIDRTHEYKRETCCCVATNSHRTVQESRRGRRLGRGRRRIDGTVAKKRWIDLDRTRSLAYAQEPADGMRRQRRTDGMRQQHRTNEVAELPRASQQQRQRQRQREVGAAAALRELAAGQCSPRDRGAEGRRLRRVRVRIRWGKGCFDVEWAGI